jgi:hypothetical protein
VKNSEGEVGFASDCTEGHSSFEYLLCKRRMVDPVDEAIVMMTKDVDDDKSLERGTCGGTSEHYPCTAVCLEQ